MYHLKPTRRTSFSRRWYTESAGVLAKGQRASPLYASGSATSLRERSTKRQTLIDIGRLALVLSEGRLIQDAASPLCLRSDLATSSFSDRQKRTVESER